MSSTTKPRKAKKQPTGGCACWAIRYKRTVAPLIVHACHCCDCQRVTGSAFVINLWMERKPVEGADAKRLRSFRLTGGTGKPHGVFFCRDCGFISGAYIVALPAISSSSVPAPWTIRAP